MTRKPASVNVDSTSVHDVSRLDVGSQGRIIDITHDALELIDLCVCARLAKCLPKVIASRIDLRQVGCAGGVGRRDELESENQR
jgi:hypothetical protein